jgi:hypothetical protein
VTLSHGTAAENWPILLTPADILVWSIDEKILTEVNRSVRSSNLTHRPIVPQETPHAYLGNELEPLRYKAED